MTPRESIISCIGTSYVQPIVDLYEKMYSFNYSGRNEIKVSSRENGYAVSIIIITISMIESAINRMKYDDNKNENDNLSFSKKFFDGNNELIDGLTEIYIIRDSILHNHIWEFTIEYSYKNFEEKILKQKLIKGYGDKKYEQYVDKEIIMTKHLKLNVNPIKIGKYDVSKVFKYLYNFLKFLDKKNILSFPALREYIKYKNKLIMLDEFIEQEILL